MQAIALPLRVSEHDPSRICDANGRAIAECWGFNGDPGVPAEDVARQIVAAVAQAERLRHMILGLSGLLEARAGRDLAVAGDLHRAAEHARQEAVAQPEATVDSDR